MEGHVDGHHGAERGCVSASLHDDGSGDLRYTLPAGKLAIHLVSFVGRERRENRTQDQFAGRNRPRCRTINAFIIGPRSRHDRVALACEQRAQSSNFRRSPEPMQNAQCLLEAAHAICISLDHRGRQCKRLPSALQFNCRCHVVASPNGCPSMRLRRTTLTAGGPSMTGRTGGWRTCIACPDPNAATRYEASAAFDHRCVNLVASCAPLVQPFRRLSGMPCGCPESYRGTQRGCPGGLSAFVRRACAG